MRTCRPLQLLSPAVSLLAAAAARMEKGHTHRWHSIYTVQVSPFILLFACFKPCSTKDTWGLTYAAWSSPKKCPRASRQVHWSSCRVGISALLLLRKSAKVLDLPSGAPPCSCLGAISAVDDPFRRVSDCGCSCLLGCQGPVQVQGAQGLMDWLVIQEAHDHEQGRGHAIGSGRLMRSLVRRS